PESSAVTRPSFRRSGEICSISQQIETQPHHFRLFPPASSLQPPASSLQPPASSLFHTRQNIVLAHQQQFLSVDLDLGPGVSAKQHAVSLADLVRRPSAVVQ